MTVRHPHRIKVLHLLLLSAMLLSACAPASATLTPIPGGGAAQPGSPADPASSAPAESAGGAPSESINPQAGQADVVGGLPQPPFSLRPAGAVAPTPEPGRTGSAMLVIGGDLPLVLSGGECVPFEGDTYLSIPNTVGAPPPHASLVINGGEGLTRSGYLVWATSSLDTDGATVSTQDVFVITLNEDGFSGRFEGTAHRVTDNIPVLQQIPVNGVFTCVASLLTVRGPHPVDLDGARCELAPQFVMRAGERGQNQVLLMLEPGSEPGDSDIAAGISWRVGGVTYTSTWLTADRNPDGLSGSYYGQATGPDGAPFEIQGTFNCLGG